MPPDSSRQIWNLITGFRATQLLFVAAATRLADHLGTGPLSAERVSEAAGTHPRSTLRILRGLAQLDVVREAEDGVFVLTDLGQLLRTDVAGSMRPVALLYGEDWLWRAYGSMLYSVRTGEPGFTAV